MFCGKPQKYVLGARIGANFTLPGLGAALRAAVIDILFKELANKHPISS